MKYKEIEEELEQIIILFKKHPKGLTTAELYQQMQLNYGFDKESKTLHNRLKLLASGEMSEVECTLGNPRCKHQLIDRRSTQSNTTAKSQLIGEEHAYMRLALQAIKELPSLSDRHYEAIEERFKLGNLNTPYFIESQETEILEPTAPDTNDLIYAIKHDHLIRFAYHAPSSQGSYIVEPYKLITFDGLWYLFGKDTEEIESSPYKTWRLKHIEVLEIDRFSKHPIKDSTIEKVLEQASDADFVVEDMEKAEVKSILVKVSVTKHIADDILLPGFVNRYYDKSSGRYLVTCDVSSIDEIDKDIKRWLPHIQILQPLSYKKAFEEEIKSYVEQIDHPNILP